MTGPGARGFQAPGLHDGGFVHGAICAAGSVVFTAGVSPLNDDGVIGAPDDLAAQTLRCLDALGEVLAAGGARPAGIAKLTVYVATTDSGMLGEVWRIVDDHFAATPPAVVVGVTCLPYPGQLVELAAVAVAEQ